MGKNDNRPFMTTQELKQKVKFIVDVVNGCQNRYKNIYINKPLIPYSIHVDGQYIDCKHYAKHDKFFIQYTNDLEIDLLNSGEKLDGQLMIALKNFNDCEDIEDFDTSTLINFTGLAITTGALSYIIGRVIFDIHIDFYTIALIVGSASIELFELSQTLCPDQLRDELVGNLTRWGEDVV